jgi:hypothetical protein
MPNFDGPHLGATTFIVKTFIINDSQHNKKCNTHHYNKKYSTQHHST